VVHRCRSGHPRHSAPKLALLPALIARV